MAKKANQKKDSSKGGWMLGAGIGAFVAGAAGAYFLYGTKEGAKRRKQVKGWAVRMKGDVMKRLERLKEVNEETYNKVIDEVASQYKKVKSIDPEDVNALVNDMKRYWKNISKELHAPAKKKSTSKKGTAKKTTSPKKTNSKAKKTVSKKKS